MFNCVVHLLVSDQRAELFNCIIQLLLSGRWTEMFNCVAHLGRAVQLYSSVVAFLSVGGDV